MLPDQPLRESQRVHRGADLRQKVEGPPRGRDRQKIGEARKRGEHLLPDAGECGEPAPAITAANLQGFQGDGLGDGGRADDHRVLDLHHVVEEVLGDHEEAHAPARHPVGLRHAE